MKSKATRIAALFIIVLSAVWLSGCRTSVSTGITQVATIDALLAGVYDGHMSLDALSKYGDFGIGTFEGLDGEMILLGGQFYQIRADGKVYRPQRTIRTPFACVTHFAADYSENIGTPTDMTGLERRLDQIAPRQNEFCAFQVHGEFSAIRTRSVPAQTKPYRPLAEVTKTQPVFNLTRLRGTLIGFRSPPFVKGVNVPGYHMHFLADDLSAGGHVLEFQLTRGTLAVDTTHDWMHIQLPSGNDAFGTADLKSDRTLELKAAEK